jgi:hypothetical protein
MLVYHPYSRWDLLKKKKPVGDEEEFVAPIPGVSNSSIPDVIDPSDEQDEQSSTETPPSQNSTDNAALRALEVEESTFDARKQNEIEQIDVKLAAARDLSKLAVAALKALKKRKDVTAEVQQAAETKVSDAKAVVAQLQTEKIQAKNKKPSLRHAYPQELLGAHNAKIMYEDLTAEHKTFLDNLIKELVGLYQWPDTLDGVRNGVQQLAEESRSRGINAKMDVMLAWLITTHMTEREKEADVTEAAQQLREDDRQAEEQRPSRQNVVVFLGDPELTHPEAEDLQKSMGDLMELLVRVNQPRDSTDTDELAKDLYMFMKEHSRTVKMMVTHALVNINNEAQKTEEKRTNIGQKQFESGRTRWEQIDLHTTSENTTVRRIFDDELIADVEQGMHGKIAHFMGHDDNLGSFICFEDRNTDKYYLQEHIHLPAVERRKMKQNNMMLTYVFHHRQSEPAFNEYVMKKMSDAAALLFGNASEFSQVLLIGYKYKNGSKGTIPIEIEMLKPSQASDNYPKSYPQDMYESHIHNLEATGSVELAPTTGFYHFHSVIKITHWTKLTLDVNRVNWWFEQCFTGMRPDHPELRIVDKDGTTFYKPTDTPHIDVQFLPQEDWEHVMKSYATKTVMHFND